MTIDNKHVVALNYILHTDGENEEKVLVEKSDAENPLTLLLGILPEGITHSDREVEDTIKVNHDLWMVTTHACRTHADRGPPSV